MSFETSGYSLQMICDYTYSVYI